MAERGELNVEPSVNSATWRGGGEKPKSFLFKGAASKQLAHKSTSEKG